MLIFSGRQAASRRVLLQEMRNKEASASSTPGACGVGAPGQLATHFVRCARFLLRLIQIGLAATERTTCRAGGADFRTATPANGRAWRVRRDYIVLDATATPAAAAEAWSAPAPNAAMPSAGPINKLVMESVDTQQHSTELLDNLQIRTFDAFLLKGPRYSFL